mgnify:CR=1 FL=1
MKHSGGTFLGDLKTRNWRELIKPKTIEMDEESHSESYGKFVCEPLERGFGTTIGNTLRRILLSSLQGLFSHSLAHIVPHFI